LGSWKHCRWWDPIRSQAADGYAVWNVKFISMDSKVVSTGTWITLPSAGQLRQGRGGGDTGPKVYSRRGHSSASRQLSLEVGSNVVVSFHMVEERIGSNGSETRWIVGTVCRRASRVTGTRHLSQWTPYRPSSAAQADSLAQTERAL
jgi:hypothetical protein